MAFRELPFERDLSRSKTSYLFTNYFFNLLANVLVKISGIEIDYILYLKYFF